MKPNNYTTGTVAGLTGATYAQSEALGEALMGTRTFRTNTHLLANQLRLADDDAEQMLASEWILQRYPKDQTVESVTQRLNDGESKILWSITNCRKELVSRELKFGSKYSTDDMDFSNEEAKSIGSELTEAFRSPHGIEINIDEVIGAVFSHEGTRDFIHLVLDHGRAGAMELSGLTRKQFTGQLRRVEIYTHKHREDIYREINKQEMAVMRNEMDTVVDLIGILEADISEDVFNNQVKHYVLRHSSEEVMGRIAYTAGIEKLQDFVTGFGTEDQKQIDYRFVNAVYDEREFLEQEIARYGADSLAI